MPNRGSERGLWLIFAAVSLTWGSSFLFMKLSLTQLNAYEVAMGRISLGAATLLLLMLLTRRKFTFSWSQLGHTAVVALCLNVLPSLLYAWAETRLSSGLASIYNATTPIMTLLVGLMALRSERISGRQMLGVGLGLAGVLVIAGPEVSGGGELLAHLACVAATACYGISYVYIRRFLVPPGGDPVAQTALQLTVASVILAPGAFWWAGPLRLPQGEALAGILLLGVLGTGLCFVWNNRLIGRWSPSRAAMVTYVTPAVGVALGALVLHESLSWNLPAGLVLVILGIGLGSKSRIAPTNPPEATVPAKRELVKTGS